MHTSPFEEGVQKLNRRWYDYLTILLALRRQKCERLLGCPLPSREDESRVLERQTKHWTDEQTGILATLIIGYYKSDRHLSCALESGNTLQTQQHIARAVRALAHSKFVARVAARAAAREKRHRTWHHFGSQHN